MPPYKPMKRRDYEAWIRQYGWQLVRVGSGDFSLLDENGKKALLFIKVTHPGNEIPPRFVKRTHEKLQSRGFL